MEDKATNQNGVLNISCASCGAPAEFDIAAQNYCCRFCGAVTTVADAVEHKKEYRRLIRERVDSARLGFNMVTAKCEGCGADVIFAENEALTHCAFCGRNMARGDYAATEDFPELIIPFRITREEARRRMLDWCAQNRGRPEAKEVQRNIDSLEGFYLPYLLVKGPDVCAVRHDNTLREFQCRGFIDGMFVNTSVNVNNQVLDGMEPFDLRDLREFDYSFAAGQRVKIADLKDGDAVARVADEVSADRERFAAGVMRSKAVKVTPDVSGLMTMTALLPAYYLRAGDTVAAVNGQTGKVAVRERRDRFLLPWWLRPIAALTLLIALTFFGSFCFVRDIVGMLFITGALSVFYIIVIVTAYRNEYAGSRRFKLRRRVLTSDAGRPDIAPPTFFEKLDGEYKPVKLKFTTPLRTLRMAVTAVIVTFLPIVIAFLFNGFSFEGLTFGGAAVWLCISIPLAPVLFLQSARMTLRERPIIYVIDKKGRKKRYRRIRGLKDIAGAIKGALDPAVIIGVVIALIVLIINVKLVLDWDNVGEPSPTPDTATVVARNETDEK